MAARARRRPVPLNATASRSACFAKQIESARPDLALLAMGHNSKTGYPYLPAREPLAGTGRATESLGMAGDSGGDLVDDSGGDSKKSMADDSGGDGGRP